MASITRRTALQLLKPSVLPIRSLATAPTPPPLNPTGTDTATASSSKKSSAPNYSPPAIFPAPINPYEAKPQPPAPIEDRPKYSDSQRKLVRGIARMMGYNSKASTAIRETSRMMKGVVQGIERDRDFWYEECRLPATYQTFFQLHLLYVLMLLPRLRSLPASVPAHEHPIPEPSVPSEPVHSPPTAPQSSVSIFTKPHYESYPAELLNHFFELAESQMRRVLGRGERERVVKKYMAEMGEQWRGAGVGLDYVVGLQSSQDPAEVERADAELASWLWRNLFGARGLGAPAPGLVDPTMQDEFGLKEVEMAEQIEQVIRFMRREMSRLDQITQRDILDGNIGHWGSVTDA